jgi:hypothetical protein
MRNIKKLILILLVIISYKINSMENNWNATPEQFDNCLVAFTCESDFENSLMYKTGPNVEISFGIVTQEQFGKVYLLNPKIEDIYYFLRPLARAKMPNNTQIDFIDRLNRLLAPNKVRRVTREERELIKKAIRHNGARFWGYPTDGDSLQLWESSK